MSMQMIMGFPSKGPGQVPEYMRMSLSFEERAADLVDRMTLEEKISQMLYASPAIERLGIPEYNWWNECLHGVGRAGLATVFPQAIGMAAMWDSDLMFRIAGAVSDEARAKHHAFAAEGKRGIYQGLTFWTPNINIFRDPRWGRGMETYGEDPFLTGELGVQYIRGLQGQDPNYLKLVATAKHFAVHSGPESDRHRFNALPTERDLIETYLPHFKKAVQQGGVYSVMCAYNRLFGEPCCGSAYINNLLRNEWGFEGYMVSDCWAIIDFFIPGRHEISATIEEAAAKAVKAGTDLNCGESFHGLIEAVKTGLVSEKEIDTSVKRLMLARMKLGQFDQETQNPYASIPYTVVDSDSHRSLALEAARKSMVLLKNDTTLPFSKDVEQVAVIGPNADKLEVLLGNYNGFPSQPITPLEGIRQKLPHANVRFAPGTRLAKEFPYMEVIPAEYLFASKDLNEQGLNAAFYSNNALMGTPIHTRTDTQVNHTWWTEPPAEGLSNNAFSIKWTAYLLPPITGEYAIGVEGFRAFELFLDQQPVCKWESEHHPHMEYAKLHLQKGKPYKIELIYKHWDVEYPSIKLLWEIPERDLLEEAIALAKESDIVILCMGLSPYLEGEEMKVEVEGFAGGDRVDIKLPGVQTHLITEIMKLNKPSALVLINGSALAITQEDSIVPAILESWYPGQAGGHAIADILFGDFNPSGRLPVTFYQSVDQLPPFDDYSMANRTYKYFRQKPLYEFGHGLSYSQFEYSDLELSDYLQAGDSLNIRIKVTNKGPYDGEEVVQVYISHPDIPEGPIRSLQAFSRIFIQSGQTKTVHFTLKPEQMAIYHPEHKMIVPEGWLRISAGGSQPNETALEKNLVLTKEVYIRGSHTGLW